ncbi:VirB4 family type IV secretion system protein [Eleftheria terrae]|uniref:VirB4 family type IV secretion system protein n=1 Tax=Eleftheria terrae TaxID=1597781 RepID=UPI00263B52D6|nr:hypothetical protein [Eleftheria terrae]WKB50506.1 hypothetical protein N7L95_00220 [Eleftheria terrae]
MKKDKKVGSTADFFAVVEPYGKDMFLTKHGSLMAAIELNGQDADGLIDVDHRMMTGIAHAIYGKLNRNIVITQYYAHYDGVKVALRDRPDERFQVLSKRREAHLNQQRLSGARLVHYLEIEPEENLNKLKLQDLFRHIGSATFDKRSRAIVLNQLSHNRAFLLELEALERMASILNDALAQVTERWSALFNAWRMSQEETWAHMRFLASLNPRALQEGVAEGVAPEDLDICMSAGDIEAVDLDGMDVLKLPGPVKRYARIASVRRFINPGGKVQPGLWAAHDNAPAKLSGNYVLMTRWKPLTEAQRWWMFQRKNLALERASINFFDMLKGGEDRSVLEKQATMKPSLKKMMEELGAAEGLPVLWGTGDGYVIAFGDKPGPIRATALALQTACSNARVNLIWETVSIDRAFKALQPGQRIESNRTLNLTSEQFGAASLVYRAHIGQPVVKDLRGEEALYVLTSKDGTPFHYSPWIGGRAMVIGIGPIRTGKTFTKNTTAAHSLKYGGLYRAVDVDPGSEPLAHALNDGKGIFRVSNEAGHGYNFFASYKGPGDDRFKAHATALLLEMLKANDARDDQSLTPTEQDQLDEALETILSRKGDKTLSHLVALLPAPLRRKFARWVRARPNDLSAVNGRYAHLFDADEDAIGTLDASIGIFNLQALRNDKRAINPVLMEMLYRIRTSFEDPSRRHLPKQVDIDEAHVPLAIDYFADEVVNNIRTWGKWYASVQMWSQSPQEFATLKHWPAIRSACTTFWFMADAKMDEQLYQRTFGLSAGQCKAIRELVPKREAFIWQPELDVSKIVVLDVEDEQKVINSSSPYEASIRDKYVKAYGWQEGLRLAVEHLIHGREPVLPPPADLRKAA